MPAFARQYSDEMRAALFRAALDDEMSVKAALRAAQAGQLPDLGAKDQTALGHMAYGYASELVSNERLRRAGNAKIKGDTNAAARDIVARLLSLAAREARLLEAAHKTKPVDTGRAIGAAKLAREAHALAQALDSTPKGAASKGAKASAEPAKAKTLAERIAAQADAEQSDPTTAGDTERTAPTGDKDEQEDSTTSRTAGPVRLRAAISSVSGAAGVGRVGGSTVARTVAEHAE